MQLNCVILFDLDLSIVQTHTSTADIGGDNATTQQHAIQTNTLKQHNNNKIQILNKTKLKTAKLVVTARQ